ncbi:MAG TPA: hypothetical protein VHP13_11880 [Gammaproteobacteria bacterium]|jgi:hypothetical protein|nr:hypothetical protein [Gammaproteobacteria bacterium]
MKTVSMAALAGLLFVTAAWADSGTVRVHNDDSATVTVNTDEGYGCTADAGRECSFAMSVGKHHLTSTNHDTGNKREEDVDVTADGYDLNLSEGNP